jgi:lysozyme family protein
MMNDYLKRYKEAQIREEKEPEINWALKRIKETMDMYAVVSKITNVPEPIIAVIHMRESSFDINSHLHNGDPLTARTKQVPKGRPIKEPVNGKSYTWLESAVDALEYESNAIGIEMRSYVWDIVNSLFFLERFNGMGYRNRSITSPYLWSFTDQYTMGKFSHDGVYSPSLVDRQPGCCAILKKMNFCLPKP